MSFLKARLDPTHVEFAIDRTLIASLLRVPEHNGIGTWILKTKTGDEYTLTKESGWIMYNTINTT